MKPSKALFLLAVVASLINGAVAAPAGLMDGLMDPDDQPKFEEDVVEALAIDFKIPILPKGININVYNISQETGLKDPATGERLLTPVFGYGESAESASWPGPTLEATKDASSQIQWGNNLFSVKSHPFTSLKGKSVVDTSLHWAYSLPDYTDYSIEKNGVPIVTHLHGSHSGPDIDGNPEHFFTPDWIIKGPDWKFKNYGYRNDQPAATLWYHDHVLGITRLNVYAGLAGFYLIRDEFDTGLTDNPRHLPAGDYEKAYAIQDRMFKTNGELFYPAYEGEPYYEDFIKGTNWDSRYPTALAEFFGDFMLVNGKIWPKQVVEPCRYRLRLLNGCDSRFLVVKFMAVKMGSTDLKGKKEELAYTIIGTDQGLLDKPISSVSSLLEPGARLDIVIDFDSYQGRRIIMVNEGGDEPFGGDIPGPQVFADTHLIMAFDVGDQSVTDGNPEPSWEWDPEVLDPVTIHRVGLFEGLDEFERLMPLLGGETEENIVETLTWSEDTTETCQLNQIEEWEIFNFSGDAVSYSSVSVSIVPGMAYDMS
jgi:FtsP/CotA-like multicopper oxidase with cupredoxin domain